MKNMENYLLSPMTKFQFTTSFIYSVFQAASYQNVVVDLKIRFFKNRQFV